MHEQRGFTVVEIAVGLVALSVVATTAVPSSTGSRKVQIEAEVASVFADIRHRQEINNTENGHYVSLGASEADTWPLAPSVKPQPATLPASWRRLKVTLDVDAVRCAYVAIAGWRGAKTPIGIASGVFNFEAPADDRWYYMLAACDVSGDGSLDRYYFGDHSSPAVYSMGVDGASLPTPAYAPIPVPTPKPVADASGSDGVSSSAAAAGRTSTAD